MHPERVVDVQIVSPIGLYEIIRQWGHVADALDGTVHEARVAQIAQPTDALHPSIALSRTARRKTFVQ